MRTFSSRVGSVHGAAACAALMWAVLLVRVWPTASYVISHSIVVDDVSVTVK